MISLPVHVCDLRRLQQGNIVLQSTRIKLKAKTESLNDKVKVKPNVKVKAAEQNKNAVDPDKFKLYFDFRISVKTIRPHQVGTMSVFALFTNPPLAVAASLSFQYWRIGNVIGGSFLLVINSMTLYSIWNMIYNLISE